MFTHPGHPINCCLYDGHTESCSMHQSRRAQSTWFQTTKGFLQVKHHIDGLRNNSSVEACITNHPDWAAIRQAPHIQAILPAFPETGKDPIRISKHSWLILQYQGAGTRQLSHMVLFAAKLVRNPPSTVNVYWPLQKSWGSSGLHEACFATLPSTGFPCLQADSFKKSKEDSFDSWLLTVLGTNGLKSFSGQFFKKVWL